MVRCGDDDDKKCHFVRENAFGRIMKMVQGAEKEKFDFRFSLRDEEVLFYSQRNDKKYNLISFLI